MVPATANRAVASNSAGVGRITSRTPTKPRQTASQRDGLTVVPSSKAAPAITTSGVAWRIAEVVANGA